MAAANQGFAATYGEDEWTAKASDLVREVFETDCDVYFVFTGPAANSLFTQIVAGALALDMDQVNFAAPYKIHSLLIEEAEESAPFGAKGVGEICAVGPAPAIANAIKNAVGARVTQIPATPERALTAMQSAGDADQRR